MKKILIVDDSAELLEAMQIFLEREGYEIRILTNPLIVMQTVKEFQPDLIILDVFISGKDGRDICRSLRKNIITKYLCIMLFSASPQALKNFELYDADGFIEKPFALNDIIKKIESVLEKCKNYHYN